MNVCYVHGHEIQILELNLPHLVYPLECEAFNSVGTTVADIYFNIASVLYNMCSNNMQQCEYPAIHVYV